MDFAGFAAIRRNPPRLQGGAAEIMPCLQKQEAAQTMANLKKQEVLPLLWHLPHMFIAQAAYTLPT